MKGLFYPFQKNFWSKKDQKACKAHRVEKQPNHFQ